MTNETLRDLPRVDQLLRADGPRQDIETRGRQVVLSCLRGALDEVRARLRAGEPVPGLESAVLERYRALLGAGEERGLQRVINATGTVLHTNLGRAILSEEASAAVWMAARHYTNLEMDLDTGKRGARSVHVAALLREITGCEQALVVNNNAAAVFLALSTLAAGGETLLSRGEMVEIGGSFRVPEVLRASGTRLVEVGTTNKTHLHDYQRAITADTRAILKVHTSNYRIVGFSEGVSTADLVALGREHGLPVIEDLGSGYLMPFGGDRDPGEPLVRDVVASGVDVLTFSGDKLLGGPQAGIILGRSPWLEKMEQNHLMRALRVDKFTAAALEATLLACRDPERARREIPVLAMLTQTPAQLEDKARRLEALLRERLPDAAFSVEDDESVPGGGSLPGVGLPTRVVVLDLAENREERLAGALRRQRPAVVARRSRRRLVLDVRTLGEEDLEPLADAVREACRSLEAMEK